MTDREVQVGERFRITRIEQPDPDSYAVIHFGRYGFGCGRQWFEAERPAVGAYVVMGADGHWHVEKG